MMAGARRKNCYVPCLEGESASFGSAELHATAATRDAQNLMDARMIADEESLPVIWKLPIARIGTVKLQWRQTGSPEGHWSRGLARRILNGRSTGQPLTRHGKSDEKTFRLPFPRDVSPKLASHGGANKKIAEPFIANRWSDPRTSALGPGDDHVSSSVRAMDFDLPGGRGKRPILYGICRELVQQ